MMPGNPVVGGTVLRRAAIQSPNFVQSPLAGWAINADGSAYFANITAEGNITASSFTGTDFLINSAGMFLYSGTPAAGNLIASAAASAGTDAEGNKYLEGLTSYSEADGIATQMDGGAISLYTGSLAGGWTAKGNIFISSGGVIELVTSAGVITSNNTLDNGSGGASFGGNVVISGTLSVGGSTDTGSSGLTDGTINGTSSTAGLANGQISGTSGSQSAGTAHTHGPGSYAVTSGQHSHGPGSYAVANGTHQHAL